MKVKLLSYWIGPDPAWLPRFEAQMRRFASVEWELIRFPSARALGDAATATLGTPCCKRSAVGCCDYRPAYAELFHELYADCDWWGWCDLDVAFGDLDRLLPGLLAGGVDVLSLKDEKLSGCCAFLRNDERMRSLWRRELRSREVMADPKYRCWDEDGGYDPDGDSFWRLLRRQNTRVARREDLYLYDSPSEPRSVRWDDGRLLCPETGREALLFHFMSDRWPEGVP